MCASPSNEPESRPVVSVVIPAYNSARYLLESLESVLKQTFRGFEIIVVDDGSTDNTAELLKPYLNLIRYVRTPNRGPSSARNLAMSEVRGELVAFQDADDVWLPEKLELQVRHLKEHPEVGVVFTGSLRFNEAGIIDSNLNTGRAVPTGMVFESLLTDHFIALSTVVVRRSCLEEIGGFDESLIGAEDYNLFLRLSRRYEFGLVERVLVHKRCHDDGLSENLDRMCKDEIANLDRIATMFPDARIPRRRLEGKIHLRFGKYYLSRGEFAKARRSFSRALLRSPSNPEPGLFLAFLALPFRARAWLLAVNRWRRHRIGVA